MMTLDFSSLWEQALPFDRYVAASTQHRGLWEGLYRTARLPEWALGALPAGVLRRLLVLAEDWCGDASNTVPVLARLADAVPGLELRVIRRDEHPEVMDRYLTNGSRSIPIVIALDEGFAVVEQVPFARLKFSEILPVKRRPSSGFSGSRNDTVSPMR